MPPWLSRLIAESSEPLALVALDGRVLAASPAWSTRASEDARVAVVRALLDAPDDTNGPNGSSGRCAQRDDWQAAAWPVGDDALLVQARFASAPTSRFFTLIDAFPFAIGVHRHQRFLYVNRAAARYLGYERPDELVGRPILAIIDPSEHEPVKARVGHMMRTGEPLPERETRLVRKDGRIVIADLAAFVIRDEDGEPSYVVVARDITERKALEERLHHGQRMEAVGRLAGGIAHDFNNLLAVILSYAELIAHTLPPESPEAEHALAIQRGAERAAALTQQLLTFSRGQSTEPTPVRANDIVLGLEGFLRRSLGGHVRLATSLQGNLPSIRASAVQLEQVLLNLALNARDAMPDGGEIKLRTSLVTLGQSPDWASGATLEPGAYVCIEVVDDGMGMSPDVAQRAFEPFFTTKVPGKGTGLGLSTVYGIVAQAGGRCDLTTAPGRGTTVRVLWPALPATDGPDAPAGAPSIGPAPSAGAPTAPLPDTARQARPDVPPGRVLVVEDDEAVRVLVTRLLRGRGLEVFESAGGADALALVRELVAQGRPPEVLLSDVVMPVIDGPALAAEMRKVLSDLPVIFMSGFADDVVEQDDLEAQGFGFVPKPFVASELVARVRAAIEGGRRGARAGRLNA
ncbi:MAG: PAS domain S-box protein [Deltaproteobacteria bacterium]|nr:PAS domain S-box protein [Deltaproteobacteria bacterium]